MCTGNLGGGWRAEAPFAVKMSPLFGENALGPPKQTPFGDFFGISGPSVGCMPKGAYGNTAF